jgi:hypothetical protein
MPDIQALDGLTSSFPSGEFVILADQHPTATAIYLLLAEREAGCLILSW